MSSNFNSDLSFGNFYEKQALEYFKYDSFEIKTGMFKPYDLLLKSRYGQLKIEVKADRLAWKTGNLAIEYECSGKPSGISSTRADYYLYFVKESGKEDKAFKIPVKDFPKLVKGCRSVSGGDGYRSKMYLLPYKFLSEYLVEKIKIKNV